MPGQIGKFMIAGSYFVLAMLDKLWHQNLTEEEAFQLHIKGVDEVKKRLVVAPPDFIIKVCRSLSMLQSSDVPAALILHGVLSSHNTSIWCCRWWTRMEFGISHLSRSRVHPLQGEGLSQVKGRLQLL